MAAVFAEEVGESLISIREYIIFIKSRHPIWW